MDNMKIEIDMSKVIAYSGIVTIKRKDLEKLKETNRKANIQMTGLLVIAKDVSPNLASETIEKVKVRGIIKASPDVKAVLHKL